MFAPGMAVARRRSQASTVGSNLIDIGVAIHDSVA